MKNIFTKYLFRYSLASQIFSIFINFPEIRQVLTDDLMDLVVICLVCLTFKVSRGALGLTREPRRYVFPILSEKIVTFR